MQMRLAFAVAVHAEPDVLLVDEVLAVGDTSFQRKCLDKIRRLRMNGCTLILVSHDPSLIRDMCDEALWLQEGTVREYGPAPVVVREYACSFENETLRKTVVEFPPAVTSQGVVLRMGENRFGSLAVRFTDIRIHTDTDPSGLELKPGDCLTVEAEYSSDEPVDSPIFGISINRTGGSTCFTTSTDQANLEIPSGTSGHITLKIERVELDPGTYFVDVGVYHKNWQFAYDYHARTYPIVVRHKGMAIPAPREEPGVPHVHWIFNTAADAAIRNRGGTMTDAPLGE
jgi:lipopolysaccharide transport system ATP-binding protein